ncbi:outer membrane protein assembly factor BamA [Sulfurospirillum arcachonense]|uniref:outer membrane protein assembly factor BamA n=1 Tax=Sulfurospirillum arcachonense TaxID=57666 RepID=UPI00046AA73E|nr:outer membrane protein assembly factor BamA [Sulfurospirillum arcachonense]
MRKLLLLSFIIVSFSQAAIVKSLKFDGLIHLSEEVASEMIGIKQGDFVNIEIIDKAIKTLYKQGYFKDVWVEEAGHGDLVFHFKEKPTISKIELDGISDSDKEKIFEFLGMQKGEVYDLDKATLSELRVVKFYEAQGYFDTVVEHKKEVLNENSIVIKFQINRGEEVSIETVNMCGSNALEYSDFEPKMANKEAEWLPWMWGFNDGKLRLNDLQYDPARIKDVYMQNGYLDAKVSEPFLKAYLDSYTATLTYNINEGQQYKIDVVDIIIPKGFIEVETLKDEMVLKSGDVFDVERLRRDVKRVETKVADLGYAYVRVIPDIKKNTQGALASITLRVIPGQKVYINDVRISGNSRTIDRVVRRDVFLAAGDLYNRTDLQDTKSALKRSSYFESVNIKEKRVSKDKIDLVVEVTEASTGSIGGGIGYGSSDGLLLSANLSDTNIFGSGITASVDVERSDKELTGRISLTNPRVFDSVYSVGGSIYSEDSDYADYDEQTIGFNVTVGRRFGRNIKGSVSYVLEQTELSDFGEGIDMSLYTEDKTIKSSIIPAITYNTTDDYYLPRRGMIFKSSLEFAGLGGDEEFIKSITKFNYYFGLKDLYKYDLILRYKSQFQYVSDNGYLPINEKVYMGGVRSVRGYDSSSISPKNSYGSLTGGTMMAVNTIEASFPLVERLKMRGALFFDYGMMGEDDLNIKRGGTGAVIEWVSPMGPISLIFAQPLFKEAGDDTASFEFTMGRQF